MTGAPVRGLGRAVAVTIVSTYAASPSILTGMCRFVFGRNNAGGDRLTAGLAEAMNIPYAEAEGIKVGMAPEVQAMLEAQVQPLGRELRASLDFFEHQQDRPVSQIYVTGGSARSEMILKMLHTELIVDCKTWNPTAFLQLALHGQQAVEIEQVGPQLSVAIGAALAAI